APSRRMPCRASRSGPPRSRHFVGRFAGGFAVMTTDEMLGVIDQAKREIIHLRADNTYLAKFLLDLREKLALFVDEIEDEGDRVYLGSTNHADYLREAEERMTEIWYQVEDKVGLFAKDRDLYSELRELRAGME